jgi:CheY-like chemotaxis protein
MMHLPDRLRGMRILVVDDEHANLRTVARLLRAAGCASSAPDLLPLDRHMPGIDGYAVMDGRRAARTRRPIEIGSSSRPPAGLGRPSATPALQHVSAGGG